MENFGDLLGRYLLEKISGQTMKFIYPKKQPWYKLNKKHYISIGSILHHATKDSIVWGSGIIDRKHKIDPADFRAVRGPRTRDYLLNLGYECPEIYGDAALLLPEYYNPRVEKQYKLGIIPHYHDYKEVVAAYKDQPNIKIIDMMTLDVEEVTRQILQCEQTISSSLHGLIVSHAYGIPSVWVEFSQKLFGDGIKFADYLESVKLFAYQPEHLTTSKSLYELEQIVRKFPSLPETDQLGQMKSELLTVCPFLN